MNDLSGKKFGRLTALRPTNERRQGHLIWLCECDCGNTVKKNSKYLKNANTKSCGCIQEERLHKFDKRELFRLYWDEECSTGDIGKIYKVNQSIIWKWMKRLGIPTRTPAKAMQLEGLKEKMSKANSGRIRTEKQRLKMIETATKHGGTGTRLYVIWGNMKRRCNCPKAADYKGYGERGISICDEWLDKKMGFINFYNFAMANGYVDNLTIDRIDNNGNYNPGNCQWITRSANAKKVFTDIFKNGFVFGYLSAFFTYKK